MQSWHPFEHAINRQNIWITFADVLGSVIPCVECHARVVWQRSILILSTLLNVTAARCCVELEAKHADIAEWANVSNIKEAG